MPWTLDARISVFLGSIADLKDDDAALIEGEAMPDGVPAERFEPGPHAAGCACCVSRSPAAIALDRLFQRRARGQVGFFRRVVAVTATAEGDMAVWAAVRDDPVASARYKLAGDPAGTS